MKTILVATNRAVVAIDGEQGTVRYGQALERSPGCIAADPADPDRAWCGTANGVLRTDDRGASWHPAGLADRHVTALTAGPLGAGLIWAGTEPSGVWRSDGGGDDWEPLHGLATLPSSSEWSFPPRPDTHHVRWISCHPHHTERLWVAVEAGALISTRDGGRTWHDRVAGGPYDTHELALHPDAPDTLHSAAGDGYYVSRDGGETWTAPSAGLDLPYLRSVAIDPARADLIVVSAASSPFTAYRAGRSDGRIYRRTGEDRWQRVGPTGPVIAPLLMTGWEPGELWAADETGLHWSSDSGSTWRLAAPFDDTPAFLTGLARLARD